MWAPRQGRTFRTTCKYGSRPGGRGGAGAQVTCTRAPMRDRMRSRGADMCQAPAPRDSPLGGRGRAPSPRHRRRATHLHAGSRGTRRQGHPGRELGAGRYPIPCDYEVCSCGWLRHRPGGVGVRSERLSEHHGGHGAVDVVGPVAPPGARPAVGTKECTQIGKNDLSEPFRGHSCTLLRRCGQTWGRRSVHRLAKTAPRHRSEAFVYTVATRGSRELGRESHRVARVPQPPWRAGGAHSVAVSPLVGKTGSARVAPPLGWRLHRGINPH